MLSAIHPLPFSSCLWPRARLNSPWSILKGRASVARGCCVVHPRRTSGQGQRSLREPIRRQASARSSNPPRLPVQQPGSVHCLQAIIARRPWTSWTARASHSGSLGRRILPHPHRETLPADERFKPDVLDAGPGRVDGNQHRAQVCEGVTASCRPASLQHANASTRPSPSIVLLSPCMSASVSLELHPASVSEDARSGPYIPLPVTICPCPVCFYLRIRGRRVDADESPHEGNTRDRARDRKEEDERRRTGFRTRSVDDQCGYTAPRYRRSVRMQSASM